MAGRTGILRQTLKTPKGSTTICSRGLEPKGVPQGLQGTILPFAITTLMSWNQIVKRNKANSPLLSWSLYTAKSRKRVSKKVRDIATKIRRGADFDEISIGFKLTVGGSHLLYKVTPDMAVFSKGMSNGYPMAAIIGKKEVMQAAQDTFISSTYWTESIGPVSALATIKKMQKHNVPKYLIAVGEKANKGLQRLADKHGINVKIEGTPTMGSFAFQYGKDSNAVRTLFTQEMLSRGILASSRFYPSYAHTNKHLNVYFKALDAVFAIMKKAINEGAVLKRLRGPVAHSRAAINTLVYSCMESANSVASLNQFRSILYPPFRATCARLDQRTEWVKTPLLWRMSAASAAVYHDPQMTRAGRDLLRKRLLWCKTTRRTRQPGTRCTRLK